jgi:hypothetical protein
MNQDYLPSKQFIHRVIAIAIILAIVLGIYEIARYFGGKSKILPKSKLVVKSLTEQDANNNTIPDWEEKLWGLDPTKNGPENKEFILAKRATIAKDRPDLAGGDTPISENDALSRDFFSIIMSLQQSGTLDQNSIQAVSEAIGKKVEATPIDDIYTRNMVKVVESNPDSISNYYEAFINLVIKYGDKNIGDELIFINQGLVNKDPNAIKQINSISKAYRDFGAEFIKIPVPNTLVNPHISLANNYEKVGQSIVGMTNLLGDPLSGIKSFINYKKYSDALETDIDGISGN